MQYEYTCQSYDKRGNLLAASSPASQVMFEYDLLGRQISIQTPFWKSEQEKFDPSGNLLSMKQKDLDGETQGEFTYDRFNQISTESMTTSNQFLYDSIGNCVRKNDLTRTINALNQVVNDGQTNYTYDSNGNLVEQTTPKAIYNYDALNRLISCRKEEGETKFVYDSFGRCIEIIEPSGTRKLLYHENQEIGSLYQGRLDEFRLMHPSRESTFAIELKGEVFFPIQDFRHNISALQKKDGKLAQWSRFSAFGDEILKGDLLTQNPWRFANRRQVAGLSLFTHRFYNPKLMRWMNPDPIGFEDGLNLYAYVHNNPMYYSDPDGKFVLPLIYVTWTAIEGFIVTFTTAEIVATVAATAAVGYSLHCIDNAIDEKHKDYIKEKDEKEQRERDEKNVFPENPDNLLPDLPRDPNGRIYPADNIRIRPEKHDMEEGKTHNPRHHEQHYHVETKRDPDVGWGKKNIIKLKPEGYVPGSGTGFLPGEEFPGII